MATEANFVVEVTPESAQDFARLSGDWNPLHTDGAYAAGTAWRRVVLHGAYSAGLVSRMAGMFLPGRDCLLHNMRLRFVAPVVPPAALAVNGRVVADNGETGSVAVAITDRDSGMLYTEASYDFGRHRHDAEHPAATAPAAVSDDCPEDGWVLVSGASGALGQAVMRRYGARAVALTRTAEGYTPSRSVTPASVAAVVHCGWPAPDNLGLLRLEDVASSVGHAVAKPLELSIAAARLLRDYGREGATLVLVGSTSAQAGRHNWRMPLYSLGKSTMPVLAEILGMELAATRQRCLCVVFDVIDGGMNAGMSPRVRQMHADRSPWQRLLDADEAAAQVAWVVDAPGPMASGGCITLSGGALP
ncbi:MaoC/PaaZ C-terminal domain-containing protein [Magnetospirillum aberrantis]|uniref:SDR family oxidoreductase n=1 Tax=Magnetospirillum aberrantis SpK TaxID=908842 RepID=A0A7C9UWM0_9PROT|nr:MaoC/PaaZ C-terminal domain-containing protein [Magnetospirillum aberrantis]NFV78555.1 SDR family oxidoreductase [Magnetospirillum aberrantis SpK]